MELKTINSECAERPTPAELTRLGSGDVVRLALSTPTGSSRFWARITAGRRSNGTLCARALDRLPGMEDTPLVIFSDEHVHGVLAPIATRIERKVDHLLATRAAR